jgi:hypothetical protein
VGGAASIGRPSCSDRYLNDTKAQEKGSDNKVPIFKVPMRIGEEKESSLMERGTVFIGSKASKKTGKVVGDALKEEK